MTLKEHAEKSGYLRHFGRRVTEAYEKGNRFFDQMKEIILIRHGLTWTSAIFHQTAHWFPGQFDQVGELLHQRHILQEYGATPAFAGTGEDMEELFAAAIDILTEIVEELGELIRQCDEHRDYGIGRQAENLQAAASRQQERYFTLWAMYEKADSPTSYDNWAKQFLDGEEEG